MLVMKTAVGVESKPASEVGIHLLLDVLAARSDGSPLE